MNASVFWPCHADSAQRSQPSSAPSIFGPAHPRTRRPRIARLGRSDEYRHIAHVGGLVTFYGNRSSGFNHPRGQAKVPCQPRQYPARGRTHGVSSILLGDSSPRLAEAFVRDRRHRALAPGSGGCVTQLPATVPNGVSPR